MRVCAIFWESEIYPRESEQAPFLQPGAGTHPGLEMRQIRYRPVYNAIMRKYLLLMLSLAGLFVSLYLLWAYTSTSRPMVCMGTGCETVRASVYAHLWGFPLPLYGVAMYLALVLLIFAQPLVGSALGRLDQVAVVAIACGGFLFSVYLTGLEAFVIHAWCTWCLTSAIAVTLIFLLALWEAIRPPVPPDRAAAFGVVRRQFGLIILGALVGVPLFIHLERAETPPPPEGTSEQVLKERLVRPDSHVTGNPQSSVTVVEFGDFECPVCGQEETAVEQIRKQFADRIRFVFRQFPIPSLHPQAEQAAEASECAADQGKFWEMHDQLYANREDLSVPSLKRDAAAIGLDQQRFNQCLESGATAARVQRDRDDGHALHVRATPTFFVGDRMMEGPVPAQLAAAIDHALTSRETVSSSLAPTAAPDAAPADGAKNADKGGNQAAPPAAARANSASSPASSPAGLSGFGIPTSPFAPSGSSELTCSEDQAQKRQPAEIATDVARNLYASSQAVFVDVRPGPDFAKGHIRGALNVPADEMDERWNSLPKDKTLVLYESGGSPGDACAQSKAAGRILFDHGLGFSMVRVYKEGFTAWEKAGLPVDR